MDPFTERTENMPVDPGLPTGLAGMYSVHPENGLGNRA